MDILVTVLNHWAWHFASLSSGAWRFLRTNISAR